MTHATDVVDIDDIVKFRRLNYQTFHYLNLQHLHYEHMIV